MAALLARLHGWICLTLVVGAVLLTTYSVVVPRKASGGIQNYLTADDPDYAEYLAFTKRFASNEVVIVAMRFPTSALDPAALAAIAQTHDRLAALRLGPAGDVPPFASVLSVAHAPDLSSLSGLGAMGALVSGRVDTVAQTLSKDPELEPRVRARLLDNPLVAGKLISPDLRTAAVVASVANPDLPGVDRIHLTHQLRAVVAQLRADRPEVETHLGGPLVTSVELTEYMTSDMNAFGVAVIALIVTMLTLTLRHVRWVLLAMGTAAVAIAWTRGVGDVCELPITLVEMMTITLTTICATAITVQLVVRFEEELQHLPDRGQGLPRHERKAVAQRVIAYILRPTAMVTLTTALGFGSLAISEVSPIRAFGVLMSVGVLVGWLSSLVGVTLLIVELPTPKVRPEPPARALRSVGGWLDRITDAARSRQALTLAMVGAWTAFCVVGALQVRVQRNFVENFRAGSPTHQTFRFIEQNLTPLGPVELVVASTDQRSVLRPEVLRALAQIQKDAMLLQPGGDAGKDPSLMARTLRLAERNLAAAGGTAGLRAFGSAISLADVLRLSPLGDPLASERTLKTALGLLGRVQDGPSLLRNFVSPVPGESQASQPADEPLPLPGELSLAQQAAADGRDPTLLRVNLLAFEDVSVTDKLQLGRDLSALAKERLAPLGATAATTGLYLLYSKLLQDLIESQIYSFGFTVLTVTMIVLVGFWSWRLALACVIPTLLPVVLTLGLMGWLGVTIDMTSLMVFSIAMGICIDTTIYYLRRYALERQAGQSIADAIHLANAHAGRASVFSQSIIIGGFWVLCLSEFLPTATFGLLLALTLIVGSVAHFMLMPLLLELVDRAPGKRAAAAHPAHPSSDPSAGVSPSDGRTSAYDPV